MPNMNIDHLYVPVKVLPNVIASSTMEKRKRPPLGAYIYARRTALGLTQKDAAAVAETTPAYWAQIENGTVKLPGAALRRGIAKALGVNHLDLLVAAGELTPDEAGVPPRSEPDALSAIHARLDPYLAELDPEELDHIERTAKLFAEGRRIRARQAADPSATAPTRSSDTDQPVALPDDDLDPLVRS